MIEPLGSKMDKSLPKVDHILADPKFVEATKTVQARITALDPDNTLNFDGSKIMQTLLQIGDFGEKGTEAAFRIAQIMKADRHTSFEDALKVVQDEQDKK